MKLLRLAPVAGLLLGTMVGAAESQRQPQPERGPGVVKMEARLLQLQKELNPDRNPIMNRARAEALRAKIAKADDPVTRLEFQIALGYELTQAGETLDAIEELISARAETEQLGAEGVPVYRALTEMLAIAYLRQGEQENCIIRHNADSCLLPIRGSGVYTKERATRRAITEYMALLAKTPDDLSARWLLNLAHMTLGEYPAKVPESVRIPPSVFESEYDLKRFLDVAPRLGLAEVGHAGGVIMDDMDGDGYLDVVTTSWFLGEQMHLYRNNGDGTFTDCTAKAGLIGETGGLNMLQADYNNDGHTDILVLRGAWLGMVGEGNHPSSLLRNNGDGTFEDVTEESGLLRFRPTQAGGWADYNGDGWLDLYIGVESTESRSVPSELWRNNRNGTFTEVSAESGLKVVGFVKGVAWGDYNNDGRPDLHVSRFGQTNLLFRNDGPAAPAAGAAGTSRWTFTDVTAQAGVGQPINSFATWFFDYDNDGWSDLFVAPFLGFGGRNLGTVVAGYLGLASRGETPRLYRNKRDGTFEDMTAAMRLNKPLVVMGSNFGDLDSDGWPDIYLGTGEPELGTLIPNRMFRNNGGRVYQDVTTAGGFGHVQKGHGVSFGDIDNDGDQDIYAVMGGAYEGDIYQNALFKNPGHGNHWMTLAAQGVRSNRSAIGARIKVTVDSPAGPRDIHVTVGSGGSFGASPLRQTIGLGDARAVQAVEIRWPGGSVQRFEGVAMDRTYTVKEGDAALRPITLKRLQLAEGEPADHLPSMIRPPH